MYKPQTLLFFISIIENISLFFWNGAIFSYLRTREIDKQLRAPAILPRTRLQFPVLTLGSLQLPITPGCVISFSGLHRCQHSCAHNCHIDICTELKNDENIFLKKYLYHIPKISYCYIQEMWFFFSLIIPHLAVKSTGLALSVDAHCSKVDNSNSACHVFYYSIRWTFPFQNSLFFVFLCCCCSVLEIGFFVSLLLFLFICVFLTILENRLALNSELGLPLSSKCWD